MICVNAAKIRELREKAGLTTYELADEVSASQTMISHIENEARQPTVALLKRIADFFKVTVDELIVDTDKHKSA